MWCHWNQITAYILFYWKFACCKDPKWSDNKNSFEYLDVTWSWYFQIFLIYNVFSDILTYIFLIKNVFSDILTYIFLIYRLFSDTFNKYSSTFSKFVIFSLRLTSWQISISGRLYKCQKQTERGAAIEQIISNCCKSWDLKLGKFKNCWASTVMSEPRFDAI